MSDQETYGARLERKIDSLQLDTKNITETQIKQGVAIEHFLTQSKENARELERIDEKVRLLENKSNSFEGGLNVLRWFSGVLTGSIVGLAAWLGSAAIDTQRDTSLNTAHLSRQASDLNTISIRVARLEQKGANND